MPSFIGIAFLAAAFYCFYMRFTESLVAEPEPRFMAKNSSSVDYSSNFSNSLDANLSLHRQGFEYGETGRSYPFL